MCTSKQPDVLMVDTFVCRELTEFAVCTGGEQALSQRLVSQKLLCTCELLCTADSGFF